MIFFHISDLHIGKQLHYYSLKEDQEKILNEIVEYASEIRPQAIVIAGDIYDKSVPSAEAVAVFDAFIGKISELDIKIIAISGNHDSPERLEFASSILGKQNFHISGMPPLKEQDHLKKVSVQDTYGEVHFWLMPFLKPGYVKNIFPDAPPESYTDAVSAVLHREAIQENERNVLVTHQFFTGAGKETQRSDSESVYVGGTGNVDISAVNQFDYVAMGHIHKAQTIGEERFRYCGTLLKYSAGESRDQKTLTVVELKEKGVPPVIQELPLHPLRDVCQKKGSLEELLEEGCTDYVSLTLTDEKTPYQPREQLERVYPYILELKVENTRTRSIFQETEQSDFSEDPVKMFMDFYESIHGKEMEESEKTLVEEIMKKLEDSGK